MDDDENGEVFPVNVIQLKSAARKLEQGYKPLLPGPNPIKTGAF